MKNVINTQLIAVIVLLMASPGCGSSGGSDPGSETSVATGTDTLTTMGTGTTTTTATTTSACDPSVDTDEMVQTCILDPSPAKVGNGTLITRLAPSGIESCK